MFSDGTSGADEYRGYIQYAHGTNDLRLATDGGERLRITSVGEVIINDTAKVADSLFGIKVDPSTHNGIGFKPTSNGSFGALRTINAAGNEVCNIQYDTTNANINFRTSNTEKVRIKSDGGVEIKDGDLIIETAGHGINFHPHSGTANLLDDYEEGTFTAVCNNGVTLNSGGDLLTYTRIGRQVTVRGQIAINSSNSNSQFNITNMPFANANTNEDSDYAIGAVRVWDVNLPSDCINPLCMMSSNGSNLQFYCNRDNASASALEAEDTSWLAFTITYFTDA